MAIYHLSVKPISRAGGRSATAAAAYRSGGLVHDLTSDEVFDYTRKRGVEHSEIVLPTAAARADINWARDREALWNAAEIAEVRKDARVAREYEVALPHELNRGQRVELVRAFAGELANRYGVAVDFSIHAPHRNGDERNHHAHIMTTTREVTATGLGPKAAIEWSDTDRRKKGLEPAKSEVKAIRERWAVLTNEHLLQRGLEVRVDHRSLQEQGIDREPQSHLGPAVSGMERRGMETEVGKRISWEMQAAAQARLERAAEIGKLAREREQLQLSSLDLSGDLKLAKEERARAAAPEPKSKEIASGMSLAERLDMLSDEVAKRLEAEAAPARAAREEEARRRALDVAQQQDHEHGRGRSRGRSIGDDDDELKRKLDRGKDFGLER
jgi:ATP-dependent exoDNAse (exonuclease V) alpha subunit